MSKENKVYVPVQEGYWKCRVVFVDEKKKFVNGSAVESAHTVLRISVVPVKKDREDTLAPENAQVYSFDLPLMFDPAESWRFWDEAQKRFVERKPTAKDTEEAIKKAREAIPEWDKFINERAQSHSEVFSWFYGDEFKAIEVTCKIKEPRSYVGSDGMEKFAYEALLIAPKAKTTAAAWTANRETMAKAFIKLPGKAAGSAAKPAAKTVATPPQPKPSTPPAPPPMPTSENATLEGAWKLYCEKGFDNAKWCDFVTETVGKDYSTYTTWTAADWQKVINKLGEDF